MKAQQLAVSFLSVWIALAGLGSVKETGQTDQANASNTQPATKAICQDFGFISNRPFNTSDTITYIRFHELTVMIDRLMVWDEEKKLSRPQKDSVSVSAELGETIEGQKISVTTKELTDIKIEQRFETSVVISNEGPHCDLTGWKHYYSEWKPLKRLAGGTFIGLSYDPKETKLFPKLLINELKERVRTQCGEEWYRLVKKIKSPHEHPSSVGLSRYFLRISGKHKDTGKTISKMIMIELPMGC